jgi:radical SAM protein with 4Fe4S-binding SPASM domain
MLESTKLATDSANNLSRNNELSISEFESGKIVLDSLPRMIFVELSENCNLRCPMCRSAYTNSAEQNMKWELYQRIADELFPTAEVVDLRGWGESTLHPDFLSCVKYALKFGVELKIITNLSIPDQGLWRFLVESNFRIGVSFDGSTKSSFEILRKGASFDNVLRNLEVISKRATELNRLNNVYLLCVAQGANVTELRKIVEIASVFRIPTVRFSPITTEEGDLNNLKNHKQTTQRALREVLQTGAQLGVDVELTASLIEGGDPELAAKRCIHPWMYCYINYRGEVGFCDHLIGPSARKYLFGNLATNTFKEIWNNEAFRALRASHNDWRNGIAGRFEECKWCYKNRFIDLEDLVYPAYASYRSSNPMSTHQPSVIKSS